VLGSTKEAMVAEKKKYYQVRREVWAVQWELLRFVR